MDVNTRFNQVLIDSVFTSSLTLLKYTWNDLIYALPDAMVDRFCLQILPQIFHKIKWLNIESSSLERILLVVEYPNLCGLGLYNVTDEIVQRIFIGKKFNFGEFYL